MESEIKKMCDWMNTEKIFWLSDLKKDFGVTEFPRSKNYTTFIRLIKELKDNGFTECCQFIDKRRRYKLIKEIDFKYVVTGKGQKYNPFKDEQKK